MLTNLLILTMCAIFLQVNAWVGIIRADPSKAHLGDCATLSRNIGAMSVGEVKRIEGKCATATCKSNGDIRLTGCGTIRVMYPYRVLPGDLSKPFPQCCHTIVGPDNSTDTEPLQEPEVVVNPQRAFIDMSINQGSNLL